MLNRPAFKTGKYIDHHDVKLSCDLADEHVKFDIEFYYHAVPQKYGLNTFQENANVWQENHPSSL